ncbi:hypothetical protein DERF_010311 [Dermatophagoides farinae]|uniref:Nose resistant-to-fluoxetine protein N-terminal domain-containing protein n=1 Tax=Dermatophagoides farinae TaxID=6954 RepID=A0A922HZU8_DERFA|nr:hypothetical protein DERF_010311 [Dermatophagoides farinae]
MALLNRFRILSSIFFWSKSIDNAFDLAFLNDTYAKLINVDRKNSTLINENNDDDDDQLDDCQIDQFIDDIFPANYQVDSNFDFQKAIWTDNIDQTFVIAHRLIDLGRNFSHRLTPLLQRMSRQLSFLAYELQLSPQCMASLVKIVLDAAGKIPSGLLEGTLSSVGDYNQCLEIKSPRSQNENLKQFRGKYCFARPIVPHPRGKIIINKDRSLPFGIPTSLIDEISDALYFFNRSMINIGICIPSTCTADEIQLTLNSILYPITKIPIEIGPESRCDSHDKPIVLDNFQWMAIYIYSGLFLLTILASIYEYFLKRSQQQSLSINDPVKSKNQSNDNGENNNKNIGKNNDIIDNNQLTTVNVNNGNESSISSSSSSSTSTSESLQKHSIISCIIVAFSFVSNLRSLFVSKPNNFGSIDFFRLVMLIETIFMHTYYMGTLTASMAVQKKLFTGLATKTLQDKKYGFLRNFHNTDFFFSLTGLLMAYTTLKFLRKTKGRFNFLQFAINMYLRFYPTIFGVILLYYLLPLWDSGPFWHHMDQYFVYACRHQLLSSMLSYNFYDVDLEFLQNHSFCNMATWWANSCFHLILLSPLILLPLYRLKRGFFSILFLILSIIIGCLISISHLMFNGRPYANQWSRMDSIFYESLYTIYYTWPFIHHISTFVFGMLVGYLILDYPKIYFGGRIGECILTIVFIIMSIVGFQWTYTLHTAPSDLFTLLTKSASDLEIYLNITIGKLLWCSGFMWIFYICCTKREFWSKLFDFPALRPLYNLSLQIYLINLIPAIWLTFRTKDTIDFDDMFMFQQTICNVFLTTVLSFFVHLLFDKPVQNILRILEMK